ncbi:MAG: hypothetical protein FJ245_13010 [Nitrospira sp.]|nr:hypothetical protein [Nitrospira sp.]
MVFSFFGANLVIRALLLGYQGDEGEYLTQSMLVSRGQTPIIDFFVINNQVNFYYFYGTFVWMFGNKFFALRLISVVLSLLTIMAMMLILQRFLQNSPAKNALIAVPVVGLYTSPIFYSYPVMILHIVPAMYCLVCLAGALLFFQEALDVRAWRRAIGWNFTGWFFCSASICFRSSFAPLLLALAGYLLVASRKMPTLLRLKIASAGIAGAVLPALPSLAIFSQDPDQFIFDLFQIRLLHQRSGLLGSWTENVGDVLKEFVLGWPFVWMIDRLPAAFQWAFFLKWLPEAALLVLLCWGMGRVWSVRDYQPRDRKVELTLLIGSLLTAILVVVQTFQTLGYYAPALALFYFSAVLIIGRGMPDTSSQTDGWLLHNRRLFVILLVCLAIRFVGDNAASILVSRSSHSPRSWETIASVVEHIRPHVARGDLIFEYEGLATFMLDLTPPPGFAQMPGVVGLWPLLSEEEMRRRRILSPGQAIEHVRGHKFAAVIARDESLPASFMEAVKEEYKLKLQVNGISVFLRCEGHVRSNSPLSSALQLVSGGIVFKLREDYSDVRVDWVA